MDPFVFIIIFFPALFGWAHLQKVMDNNIKINPSYRFAVEMLIYIAVAFYSPMAALLMFAIEGVIGLIILRMKDKFY